MVKIKVPASSANLGPGFDCFGLALKLYLSLSMETAPTGTGWQIIIDGDGAGQLPTDEKNLIAQVAKSVAASEQFVLPPLRLRIENQIPLARGLGSSAAAITAGISIVEALLGREFDLNSFFQHALKFENHADNLSAARMGGFT